MSAVIITPFKVTTLGTNQKPMRIPMRE